MITQTVTVTEKGSQNIIIGRRNTYGTEVIVFDLSYLIETFGNGTAVLMVKRSGDVSAYPAVTEQNDNRLSWSISDVDTSYKGHGECELFWYVDDALAKSVIYDITVLRDIGETTETPPDPYQTWVDTLTELGSETLENAQDAAQSAEDAEGYAHDAEESADDAEAASQAIQDMSVRAQSISYRFPASVEKTVDPVTGAVSLLFNIPGGADGASYVIETNVSSIVKNKNNNTFAPTSITINAYVIREGVRTKYVASQIGAIVYGSGYVPHYYTNNAYTYTFTLEFISDTGYVFCYFNGSNGQLAQLTIPVVLDGKDGTDGSTPHFTVGETTTLSPGSDATVTQTGTDANPVLNFGIPQGVQGNPGTDGQDGVSPIVSTQAITGGTEVTITDKDGDHVFNVMNGEDAVVDPTLSIQGEAADAKATGDALSQLNSAINTININKADVIVSSASGAIASFPDGMAAPIKQMVVDIEPVQDLHGYDSPWPAGGGKNKFDISRIQNYENPGNHSTLVNNGDGSITVNATTSTNIECGKTLGEIADLVVGQSYKLTATTTGTSKYIYLHGSQSQWPFGGTATITQEMLDGRVSFYASGVNTSATISDIMIRLSTESDATFAPYSNECPISGHTGVTVYRTGKNLLDPDLFVGYYDKDNDGVFVPSTNWKASKKIKCKPSTQYIASGFIYATGGFSGRVLFWDEYGNYISFLGSSQPFTTPSNAAYMAFYTGSETTTNSIQLEEGSTASEYEPYSGNTYPITWQTEAGTVYSGTLQIKEDGSGVLRGTIATKNLTSSDILTQGTSSGGIKYIGIVGGTFNDAKYDGLIFADVYKYSNNASTNNSIRLISTGCFIYDNRFTDLATAKSLIGTLQVFYELATPITYTLTPEQVGAVITTLKGTNTIWVDDSDEISVEYRADTKLYIDGKLAELVAQIVNS